MQVNKKTKPKKKIEKYCQFPINENEICNKIFYGIGPAKYCDEHRQLKYRKFINKKIAKEKQKNQPPKEKTNQIIKHKFTESQIIQLKCDLCGEPFNIKIFPHTYIYPKFCPKHRSEYKRKLYKQYI